MILSTFKHKPINYRFAWLPVVVYSHSLQRWVKVWLQRYYTEPCGDNRIA